MPYHHPTPTHPKTRGTCSNGYEKTAAFVEVQPDMGLSFDFLKTSPLSEQESPTLEMKRKDGAVVILKPASLEHIKLVVGQLLG